MQQSKRQPLYELTIDGPPPHKILPFGMDESDLIDATPVGAMYRVFINQRTGEILDGGKFARYAEELGREHPTQMRQQMQGALGNHDPYGL